MASSCERSMIFFKQFCSVFFWHHDLLYQWIELIFMFHSGLKKMNKYTIHDSILILTGYVRLCEGITSWDQACVNKAIQISYYRAILLLYC